MREGAPLSEFVDIEFSLNGAVAKVHAPPTERLSKTLRERLGQPGTKVGCDAGDCGACTVLIDGAARCACLVGIGQIQGRHVETVEGLAQNGKPGPLQQTFLDHGAAQCGICTPGMLMTATALLRKVANPSDAQIRDVLGGVLCRCTGYAKIVAAIADAGNQPSQSKAPAAKAVVPIGSVGEAAPRVDGPPKVLGTDRFGADIWPANALVLQVVRAPFHRADFTLGNLAEFIARHPGLVAVLTASDIPGNKNHGVIPGFIDQPVFAIDQTRFRGEAVAAVVGEGAAMDRLDLADFPVTWEELPAALTPPEAQAQDAAQLHNDRPGNKLVTGWVARGDVDAGFAEAAAIVEATFTTGYIEHAYIEPEAGFAQRQGDRLELWVSTQAPYMNRDAIAAILAVAPAQVRIRPSAVGGGFGSKLDLSVHGFLALAAWRLDQPVRMVYSRSESMAATTKRHPSTIRARIGANKQGKLTAMAFDAVFNTGAYASWGPTVANRVPVHASGPYVVPNYQAKALAVLTNGPVSGAFRGFGVPQSAIAQETLFDELADQLGLDRLEFRLANALDNGLPTVTGQTFATGCGARKCLEALQGPYAQARQDADKENTANKNPALRHGVGLASLWYGCGNTALANPSTIKVGLKTDGTLVLFNGAVDIGQGSRTVIGQICAQALGLPLAAITQVNDDTDLTPDAGKTSASRQTFISGKAAELAGRALRAALLRLANVSDTATLALEGATLVARQTGQTHRVDLGELQADANGFVALEAATFDPPTTPLDENGQGRPYAAFGYGAHMAQITVDVALGKVKVHTITAVHDVGRAINPQLIEGQIEGGVAQGLGMALMEEFIPGRTENLHDYLIPTFGDMPQIKCIVLEEADPVGPFGAKGLGEHVLIATAPAILNAIYDACGARVRDLPATPDKVLAAIRTAQSAGATP
ncbi:MAG: molybdopterin-dependent oxidoreductase [Alphaproteobacteria bacterium]